MQQPPLEILYEDNCFIVVNKPAGELTQGDRTGDETIMERVRAHIASARGTGGRPFVAPVHRLDRPVSGALILARKSKAAERLAREFKEGDVQKVYWAVVEGRPANERAFVENWLVKNRASNRTRIAHPNTPGAAPARLYYRVLEKSGDLALVEIKPLTGRPHQIRVQLAGLGCPVAGDLRYGSKRRLGHMIALHCRSLTFTHPVSGERLSVSAPIPEEWSRRFSCLPGRG